MSVKLCGWLLGAAACVALAATQASAQNLLVNPGFELPVTQDGPPFIGFWEVFNGGAGSFGANSTNAPRNGAQHLDLTINNSDNNFAGAFQDVVVVPGTVGTWSVWQRAGTLPLGLDSEMRIEWRDSVASSEIARTPNLVTTPSLTTSYQQVSVTATVPAGADTARLVYAIQTFSGPATNTGTVYLDDASFEVVPEPAAALLSAIGVVFAWCLRRRR